MRNDNFYYLKTSEIIQAYKRKALSPVYLIESYIKRAKGMNEKYNFITEFFEESAINLAKNAEYLFAKNDKTIRPLEGIPLAVKDEFALDGTYRTSGSIIYKKRLDNFTDVYVQRLLNAGCIPIFKTTTPEFCLLGTTWSDLHGITTNPWNEKFTPGGSSGGSGVALATGCATIATGSDIGGS
ncbi:MAG: amidase, partial [Flavobacteriales bacterium]|nr:amidase [Flavobacteriales bacterium]